MTGHKNDQMILKSYNHLDLRPEVLTEKQGLFWGSLTSHPGYVSWENPEHEPADGARLQENLRAHRVRGGICSDIPDVNAICRHAELPLFYSEIEQIPFLRNRPKPVA
jgi:hypothetical protein